MQIWWKAVAQGRRLAPQRVGGKGPSGGVGGRGVAVLLVAVEADWGVGRYEGNSEGSGSCFGIGMWMCFDVEEGEDGDEGD